MSSLNKALEQLKKEYAWKAMNHAFRFCEIVDISKKKKAVFVIPEKTWYYPQSGEELADIVVNFIEHHKKAAIEFQSIEVRHAAQHKKALKPYVRDHTLSIRGNGEGMRDEYRISFGLHAGKRISEVPAEYLLWCYNNLEHAKEIQKYVSRNLDNLKKEAANKKRNIW